MKNHKKFTLRDAMFASLVPGMLILIWIAISFHNFYYGATRYRSIEGLKYFARKVLDTDFFDVLRYNEIIDQFPPEHEDSNLLIDVSMNELERCSSKFPPSGNDWIRSIIDNKRAKLSLRGSDPIHWWGHPKSLSLKFPKDDMFWGKRKWKITAEAIVNQYAADSLANYLNLFASKTKMVNVFLNRRYYSPMRLVEWIDEQFLLSRRRMPGVLIEGTNFYMSKKDIPGSERSLFLNPYSWRYEGSASLLPEVRNMMIRIAKLLLQDTNCTLASSEVERFYDLDEMAALLALQLMCNDFHMDDWHNERFYYDPLDGLLHPIWWDSGVWNWFGNPDGTRIISAYKMNRLMMRLLCNPLFYERVCLTVQYAFCGDKFEEIVSQINDDEEIFNSALALTHGKSKPNAGVARTIRKNAEILRKRLNQVELTYASTMQDNMTHLMIKSKGWGSAVFQSVTVAHKLEKANIWADVNLNGVCDPDDRVIPLSGPLHESGTWVYCMDQPEMLYAACRFSGYPRDVSAGIEPEIISYSYLIPGTGSIEKIAVEASINNETASLQVDPEPYSKLIPATKTFHPWIYGEETRDVVEFQGTVTLTNTVIVEAEDTCVIQPGTHLLLASGVSLVCYGKLTAEGTEDAPIIIDALDTSAPFGVLAMQGEGANGSKLRYVQIAQGSRATVRHVPYSGMVSIHHAEHVRLEHCSFGRNYIGDDALRVAKSDVVVSNCSFTHVRSDAIDFDFSSGTITDCRFRDTGNDAIDLMGSNITISDNDIRGCGDKGVSVGNASYPIIDGNVIAECAIGVESKDRSCPTISYNLFKENETAVHAYKKNWRYGFGGFGLLYLNRFEGNEVNVQADDDSVLYQIICNGEI